MSEIKAGDRVIGIGMQDGVSIEGLEGVVVSVTKPWAEDDDGTHLVNFGEGFDGHGGEDWDQPETCWYVSPERLKLA